jgi:hypothetical protein
MYILGLSSSWGTSRICPAWSPSEHQLTRGCSPIWGPSPKPRHQEEVVYSPNDSCSHFTQCLFPQKLPQQHVLLLMIHLTSFILIIHHIHTNNYTFLFTWHIHTFTSSDPHGRHAALGPLCPIQLHLRTHNVSKEISFCTLLKNIRKLLQVFSALLECK